MLLHTATHTATGLKITINESPSLLRALRDVHNAKDGADAVCVAMRVAD